MRVLRKDNTHTHHTHIYNFLSYRLKQSESFSTYYQIVAQACLLM